MIRGGAADDPALDEIAPHAEHVPALVQGSVVAGRYRVDRLLGSGGMGSVYRAEHIHMRKMVALKVLHREMTYLPEIVARFEREAVAAGRIEHPNVAQATDFGRLENGSFYLVLEYVEGVSLAQLLQRECALPTWRALRIARQVADALSAAHRAGVVHRDLKPDNVMLVNREGEGDLVKVLDFGIAKVSLDGSGLQPLTQYGSIFGTPEYMAPEQAAGTIVDHRADLYTLGVVLFEMLSGRAPFVADDMLVILTKQMVEPPPPLPARIEQPVTDLVMQLLAKNPDHRLSTADEVVRRIDQLLQGPLSRPQNAVVHAIQGPSSGRTLPDTLPDVPPLQPSQPLPAHHSLANGFGLRVGVPTGAIPAVLRIGSWEIPIWAAIISACLPLGAAAAISVGWLGASAFGEQRPAHPSDPTRAPAGPASASETATLAQGAARGERAALKALEEHGPRTALEFVALGRGWALARDLPRSVAAYERALVLDASLANDVGVLRDIRLAVADQTAREAALRLATTSMGTSGPDLVFDVWDQARGAPSEADLAVRTKRLLDAASTRARASPALLIALDLWNAKTCAEYRDLLPRAVSYADQRAEPVLRSLTKRNGCGILQLQDCWPCLRQKGKLSEALDVTSRRAKPRF